MRKVYFMTFIFGSSKIIKLFDMIDNEPKFIGQGDQNDNDFNSARAAQIFEEETGMDTDGVKFINLNTLG